MVVQSLNSLGEKLQWVPSTPDRLLTTACSSNTGDQIHSSGHGAALTSHTLKKRKSRYEEEKKKGEREEREKQPVVVAPV